MSLFGVKRVLHISSEETYGPFDSDFITEDHPQRPLHTYGITKLAVEHLGRTYGLTHGIECINLRTCWVYGPDFPRLRIPRTLIDAALGGRALYLPCGAAAAIDHTYIDDLVDGVIKALDHEEHPYDAYHIASGEAPTVAEMVSIVRDLVPGADLSVGQGPLLVNETFEVPRKGALDCSRAARVFGYVPCFNLRAGLAATLAVERARRP
jgi:UDP-glucose 4-epimerase